MTQLSVSDTGESATKAGDLLAHQAGVVGGESKCGVFKFCVEPFSEDFTGRLSWRVLGNRLLRCAGLHAGQCGFGFKEMSAHRRVWVLSRLAVQLERMPHTGEDYLIETWVSRIYRQFTDRLFTIRSPRGEAYGYAFSTWSLIDLATREPAELDGAFPEMTAAVESGRDVPVQPFSRVRLPAGLQPVRTLQAAYSDLDINGHVNSVRYIEMMLDLYPKSFYEEKTVRRIEVAYSAEAYCGDVLDLYQATGKDGRRLVEIRKDVLPIVRAGITFDTGR